VDCPAGLIPGVLALYPQLGNGSRTRSRSSFPSAGRDGHAVAPQEPVYSWLLPTPTCARTAVSKTWGVEGLSLGVSPWFVTRFLPGLLARFARSLRPGAPRYRLLIGESASGTVHFISVAEKSVLYEYFRFCLWCIRFRCELSKAICRCYLSRECHGWSCDSTAAAIGVAIFRRFFK